MGLFDTPKIPVPPPVPAPAPAPMLPDSGVRNAGAVARAQAAAAAGLDSTIRTGPQGLNTKASTAMKTLLGQ